MSPDTSGPQTPHHEIARPDPSDTRAYLEQMTKAVFVAGLNWKVVENKWPGFLEAFHGFDPEYVANMSPKQLAAIEGNPAVIRNRSKIEATVENANVMLQLVKEHGTFHDFLASHPDPEATVQDLKERFHHLGDSSASAFLWRVGEAARPGGSNNHFGGGRGDSNLRSVSSVATPTCPHRLPCGVAGAQREAAALQGECNHRDPPCAHPVTRRVSVHRRIESWQQRH